MLKPFLLSSTALQIPGDEELTAPEYVPPMEEKYKVGNLPFTPTEETEMDIEAPTKRVYKKHATVDQTFAIGEVLDAQFVREDKIDPDGRWYGHYREGWSDQRVANEVGMGVTASHVNHIRTHSSRWGFIRLAKARSEARVQTLSAMKEATGTVGQRLNQLEHNVRKLMHELGIEWE